MKRVTGIGGIFFKAENPKVLHDWYRLHLGVDVQDWGGAIFPNADEDGKPIDGVTGLVDRCTRRSHLCSEYHIIPHKLPG